MKILLVVLGMNPNKFAVEVGISATQIYSVINGRNAPSHAMYERIAKRFPNINLRFLICNEGQPLNDTTEKLNEKELQKLKVLLGSLRKFGFIK